MRTRSTKGNCSVFRRGATLPCRMSHCMAMAVTRTLSTMLHSAMILTNRLVDLSDAFRESRASLICVPFSCVCVQTDKKLTYCCRNKGSHTTGDGWGLFCYHWSGNRSSSSYFMQRPLRRSQRLHGCTLTNKSLMQM